MKLFFASIYFAVLSIPAGTGFGLLFLSYMLNPNVFAAVLAGGVMGGLVLSFSLVLFVFHMVLSKPNRVAVG